MKKEYRFDLNNLPLEQEVVDKHKALLQDWFYAMRLVDLFWGGHQYFLLSRTHQATPSRDDFEPHPKLRLDRFVLVATLACNTIFATW